MPLIPSRDRLATVLALLLCKGSVAYLLLQSDDLLERLMVVITQNGIIPCVTLGINPATTTPTRQDNDEAKIRGEQIVFGARTYVTRRRPSE